MFVVAAEEEEILGEFQLVAKEEHDAFDGVLPSVDVVPDEEVIRIAGVPAIFEDLQEVTVLSMDIA